MFDFKQFSVDDTHCDMKVGTDGVLLGAWVDVNKTHKVLDAGGGSGLIALMIAQRIPEADIDCVEISPNACSDAKKNTTNSSIGQRINIINDDITRYPFSPGNYDLVVSNPPYFTEALKSPDAGRAASRHEGEFGVEWLIRNASALLTADGSLAFIAPASRDGEIEFLLELSCLHLIRRCAVIPVDGQPAKRTLWQVSRSRIRPPEHSSIIIRTRDREFTAQYTTLTCDFYL